MSRIVTIQGRELAQADVDTIRQLIADNPNRHRTRLSKELCALWEWRTETGLLKDMACRSMLRKLEQKGLVTLPVAHHSGNRRRRIVDVPHDQDPIQTDLRTIRPIQLIPVQGRGAADDLFHGLMDRYHYLGCKGHVGEHMKYLRRSIPLRRNLLPGCKLALHRPEQRQKPARQASQPSGASQRHICIPLDH